MAENEQLEGQMNIYDFLPGSKNKILWEEWHKKYDKQEVNIKGIMDDGYCPKCNYNLPDLIERCPYCKTLMDWTPWKRINEK